MEGSFPLLCSTSCRKVHYRLSEPLLSLLFEAMKYWALISRSFIQWYGKRRTQACSSGISSSIPARLVKSSPTCHSPTSRPSYPNLDSLDVAPYHSQHHRRHPATTSTSQYFALPTRPRHNEDVYMRPRCRVIRLTWRRKAVGVKSATPCCNMVEVKQYFIKHVKEGQTGSGIEATVTELKGDFNYL